MDNNDTAMTRDTFDVLQTALAEFRRTLLRNGVSVPDHIEFNDPVMFSAIKASVPVSQNVQHDPEKGQATINICGIDCVFRPMWRAHRDGKVTPE